MDHPPWRNPPVGVLLRATGSLHDTVEADEFADDYPHDSDHGIGQAGPYRPIPADLMVAHRAELQVARLAPGLRRPGRMSLARRPRIDELGHTKGPETRDLAVARGESTAGRR
jgi:hypothetical protein